MLNAQLIKLDDYSSIAFAQAGRGEPVVLVHGSLCDYRYWEPQFVPISSINRVLALSLGHYFPTRELNRSLPFSWRVHIQQIIQFIDDIVCEPVHIVAHSYGAYLVFQLAHCFPERLRSITLADPSGFIKHSDASSYQRNTLHTRVIELIQQSKIDAGLELFVDSVSQKGTWARSADRFKIMARDNAHTLWPQILDQVPVFSEHDARKILLPVMLVLGEKSPFIFHQNIKWLHKYINNSFKTTIAGVSHGMNLTHPRAFNQVVLDFIKVNSRTQFSKKVRSTYT
ncbi:alpha/beta fold hydrolase [Candidatus Vallotia tarda]|nr:alpha/beta hydrolase [Candidatus Vallotia tarda]CAG7605175.1 Alpha/beta hydrolase [Candidatus Vallotia tarda]